MTSVLMTLCSVMEFISRLPTITWDVASVAVRTDVRRWANCQFRAWKGSFWLTCSRSPSGDYVPASPDPLEGHYVSL